MVSPSGELACVIGVCTSCITDRPQTARRESIKSEEEFWFGSIALHNSLMSFKVLLLKFLKKQKPQSTLN